MIGDRDEARNIVQETFAEAYRQIEDFRGEAKVSTWLFSIARHLSYGYLRTLEAAELPGARDHRIPRCDLWKRGTGHARDGLAERAPGDRSCRD